MKSLRLHHILLYSIIALAFGACSDHRITLSGLPGNTPQGAQIFVAGTFNNWNPGDPQYLMKYDEEAKHYWVDLPSGFGTIEYKFTRGDWTTVETDSCGGEYLNRMFSYDRVYAPMYISGWNDLQPLNCSRLTLFIDDLPDNTPADAQIYLGGNVNLWTCGLTQFEFKRNKYGKYYLTIPRMGEKLEFKLNRGSWETVEVNEQGIDGTPRTALYGEKDTVHLTVMGWRDIQAPSIRPVTFVLKELPPNTPKQSEFYLAGDFNDWNPYDKNFMFKRTPNGQYIAVLNLDNLKPHSFKISRGGWEKVETSKDFQELKNRQIVPRKDTLDICVANWNDLNPTGTSSDVTKSPYTSMITSKDQTLVKPDIQFPPPGQEPAPPPAKQEFPDIDYSRKIIFVINKIPTYGNKEDIYLAGDFNGWEARDGRYRFRELPGGKRYFILRLSDNRAHEYKLTRGSWDKEEANNDLQKPPNKKLNGGFDNDTVYLQIENWLDYRPTGKVVVLIQRLSPNTPDDESIYLTGDFNGWNPNDEKFRFRSLSDGRKILEIPSFNKTYNQYKITRGNWDKESGKYRKGQDNQSFRKIKNDTLLIEIDGWKDIR